MEKKILSSKAKSSEAPSGRISRVDGVPFLLSLCLRIKRINVFEVVQNEGGRRLGFIEQHQTNRRTCFRVRRQLKASLCNGRRSSGHWVCISLALPTVSFSLAWLEREREKERKPVLKGPVFKVSREKASSFLRPSIFLQTATATSQSTRSAKGITHRVCGARTPKLCRNSWRSCKPRCAS